MAAQILKGKKLSFSLKEKSLGDFFFYRAENYGDRICQIDGTTDQKETFASVKLRSTRIAIGLQKLGIPSSSVIAFCSPATLDITVSIIAAFYIGAKVANLEPSLSVRHTKNLVNLVTPRVIFVEQSSLTLIEEALADVSFQTQIIVLGDSQKYITFSDLVAPQTNEDKFRPVQVHEDEYALLLFSSGTTGLPKAICHSHYTVLHFLNTSYQCGFKEALMHFTGFYWITASLMLGSSFIGGSYRVFTRSSAAEEIFTIIEKYEVASIFMAPVLTYKLTNFNSAKNFNTSSVKWLVCGGTPLAETQVKDMNKIFPNAINCMGYGMTEVGFVTTISPEINRKLAAKKVLSCGKPVPELNLKVVDIETEELLGPNKQGEIRIASPSMMKGYYNADSSDVFDKAGFLKTGDVGYYDEDGYIYVLERIKEMFKYQSWHIVPSSIEAVLLEHPAVKEVVVFGVPSGEDGEVPGASIILKPNYNCTKEEIAKFVEERVADREKLRGGITFVESFPKTPTGKYVRKKIRDSVIKTMGSHV